MGGTELEDRPQFNAELSSFVEGLAVVEVRGEVDIYTAPQFKEVLLRAINEGAGRVVVDLAEVTFIDSTALGVLVGAVRRIRQNKGLLAVVCGDPDITRVFTITGLDRILNVSATREQALAALSG